MENKTGRKTMSKEARQAVRDYYKKWRDDNREHVREYTANYWEKRAQEAEKQSNVS